MSLQSIAAGVIHGNHRFAYAQIGPELNIRECSENISFWLPDGIESAEKRPLSEIFPEFLGCEEKLTAVLNREQEEFVIKYAKRERDGDDLHYLNLRVVALDPDGSPGGLLLIVEDVTNTARMGQQLVQYHTALNQAQEHLASTEIKLEQLEQFKSFLVSLLAHDMRTPLAAIRGYAELLLRLMHTDQIANNPDKANGFAENICYITDQMTWLINDIIDLNYADKEQLQMSVESCDIHEVLQAALEMFDSIIKLQNLTLLLELNPLGLTIPADTQRMRQVANNLIGQAIKSTAAGGEITIRTTVKGGKAILSVKDSGKGMTAEESQKIFQPFYRTKEARSSNILGSGLGLNIVKVLVEAHNGRVEVNSEAGTGSTYTVYLPLGN